MNSDYKRKGSFKTKSNSGFDPNSKRYSNDDRKAFKRKWREEKQIAELEAEKKKKKQKEEETAAVEQEKKQREECGRLYTVAIALPGSILDNAQSMELRAYLGGQIARAAAVFNVDEIVIFDETITQTENKNEFGGLMKPGKGNTQLFHILQYLECPQYLRKSFFPFHPDLAHAGLLNPLDMPHHLREADWSEYREGVTLQRRPNANKDGTYCNVGLRKEVFVSINIPPKQRVTVKIDESSQHKKSLRGQAVSPNEPRERKSTYWGYTARLESCLSDVFKNSPHEGGYDLMIGTSERGEDVTQTKVSKFKHAIIVFGGLKGLEASLDADVHANCSDPKDLFQHYVNICPYQGSRTIRTEEAVLIAMTALIPKLQAANKPAASIEKQ